MRFLLLLADDLLSDDGVSAEGVLVLDDGVGDSHRPPSLPLSSGSSCSLLLFDGGGADWEIFRGGIFISIPRNTALSGNDDETEVGTTGWKGCAGFTVVGCAYCCVCCVVVVVVAAFLFGNPPDVDDDDADFFGMGADNVAIGRDGASIVDSFAGVVAVDIPVADVDEFVFCGGN